MAIEPVRGRDRYLSDIEPWMESQWSTEVFNFSLLPYGQDEMAITEILDDILHDVMFGRGIDEYARRAKTTKSRLIRARRPRQGEEHLATWQGTALDGVFKRRVQTALASGRLKGYKGRLRPVEQGDEGPDFILDGQPLIAWDLTSQAQIEAHIERDVIGSVKRRRKLFDRYYLLIYDEPRTKSNVLLKALSLKARE